MILLITRYQRSDFRAADFYLMKLKKLSIFLCVIAILCCGTFTEYARAFSLLDLSSYGAEPMQATREGAASLDGKISDGEYGKGTSFQGEKGLYLLNASTYHKGKASSNLKQENYVLLSRNYVYCALRLIVPFECGNVSSTMQNGLQSYRVTFSLGLAMGEHPALKGSLLSNSYYFSADNFSCIGFTGERIARSVNESSIAAKPLSSFSASYRENGIVSADGTKWNADFYCKNSAFSLEVTENGTILVAEAKIPLEDLLLSVAPSQRESTKTLLSAASANLCGSYTTRVELNALSCVVSGVPSELPLPDSTSSQTLYDWMKSNFETPVSGLYIPKVIPIPLYWGAYIPASNENTSVQQGENSVDTTVPSSTAPNVTNQTSIPTITADVSLPQESDSVENDESIFDVLPNADDTLPEDTEIVYDEKASASNENEKDDSLTSTVLITVTGALLFASVMALCIYFRESDKENEKKQSDQNKRKKKNNTKNKGGRRG